jgi:predicted Zn finger-like uncharacterized protein
MPIDAQCGSCTAKYRVVDTAAGRRVKCRRCGNGIDLPGQAVPADAIAVLAQLEKTAPPAAAAPDAALFQYRAVMSTVTAPVISGPTKKHGTSIKDLQVAGGKPVGKDKRGGGGGLPGGMMIPMIVGGIVLLLAGLSFLSPIFTLALLGFGYLLMFTGSVWGLLTAFRENSLCGTLYLVLPFYSLYYLLTRWYEMKFPFLTSLTGFAIFFLAGFLGGLGHGTLAQ